MLTLNFFWNSLSHRPATWLTSRENDSDLTT